MDPDDLIDALGRTGPYRPQELHRLVDAARANADVLEAHLAGLGERAASGTYLLPWEEQALHVGLHLAAADGRSALAPVLRRLVAGDAAIREQVLGEDDIALGASLLVSLHDGDATALLAMAGDDGIDGEARWSAFLALARLVRDGRMEPAPVVDLLRRMDAERTAPPGDFAWHGWLDAVVYLGLDDFRPALEAVWQDGRIAHLGDEDKMEFRDRLAWSSAHPGDASLMTADQVAPIADATASLAWLTELPPRPRGGKDPAAAIALDDGERRWLAGFLASSHVPATAFTLEMADGFFAALVAGPSLVLPSEYLPILFGEEEEPVYESAAQAEYVTQLLMRHWNTIAQRLERGHRHAPVLFPGTLDQTARSWARGFLVGMDLRREAWRPMIDDPEAGEPLAFVMGLIADEMGDDALDDATRAEVVEHLPDLLLAIAAHWRRPTPPPRRTPKTGRNEPCPCGSGRKFKRCCGAG